MDNICVLSTKLVKDISLLSSRYDIPNYQSLILTVPKLGVSNLGKARLKDIRKRKRQERRVSDAKL